MNHRKLFKTIILLLPIIFPFIFDYFFEDTLEDAFKLGIMTELAVFTLFALVFKRSYCAFFCPAGAVQRISNYIGSKLLKKRFVVPYALDNYLRKLKYLLLLALIILPIPEGKLLIKSAHLSQYDRLFPELIWSITGTVTIVGSLIFHSFFCKYLCVQGALFGLAGRLSPSGIVRDEEKCVNCQMCSKKCPVNLEVHKMTKVISTECLNCQNCIATCPKEGALTNKFAAKEIPLYLYLPAAVAFFILVGFLAMLFESYPFNAQ